MATKSTQFHLNVSVPSVLDCGGCLPGGSKLWTTQCTNFGGEGSFKVLATDGRMESVVSIIIIMLAPLWALYMCSTSC